MKRLFKFISVILILIIISAATAVAICYHKLSAFSGYLECFITVNPNGAYSYGGIQNPNMLEWQNDNTLDMMDKWTFSIKSQAAAKSFRNSADDIELNIIGLNYRDILPVKMKYGKFLWNDDISMSKPYVVLDANLSFNLFGIEDSIGNEVAIDGTNYIVVGICFPDSFIVSKARYKAYVPFVSNMYAGGEIELTGTSKSIFTDAAAKKLENKLNQIMHGGEIHVRDLNTIRYMQKQKIRISVFVLAIIILIAMYTAFYKILKKKYKKYKNQLDTMYFVEALKANKKDIFVLILSILFLAVISICVIKGFSFRLYIPPEWMPNNFSGLERYGDIIRQNIINKNSEPFYKTSYILLLGFTNKIINTSLVLFWGSLILAAYRFGYYKYSGAVEPPVDSINLI